MASRVKNLAGDWLHSSDEDPGPCCEPCTRDNKQLPAVGYCATCNELLCCNCYRIHTIPKPSRNHVLVESTDLTHDIPSESDELVTPIEIPSPTTSPIADRREYQPVEHGPNASYHESPSDKTQTLNATSSKQRPRRRTPPLPANNLEAKSRQPDPKVSSPIFTVPCPDHKGKTIEYYCPMDGLVACNTCVTLNHRHCNKVEYIPDLGISRNFYKSTEYKKLLNDLEKLRENTTATVNDVRENRKAATAGLKASIDDMKMLKDDLVKLIEEQEAVIVDTGETFNGEDDALSHDLENDLDRLHESTEETIKQINDNENVDFNLFAASVLSKTKVKELNKELKSIADKNKKVEYKFRRDNDLQRFLDTKRNLGKLERSCTTRKAKSKLPKPPNTVDIEATLELDLKNVRIERLDDIDVATPADKDETEISGVASLSKNTLLVVDCCNKALKTVNISMGRVTDKLLFTEDPYDIALLPDNQAAVTFPLQQGIQFICTKDKLNWLRTIRLYGRCYGIAALGSHLVVSFQDFGSVKLISFKGNVLQTFNARLGTVPVFRNPKYMAVFEDDNLYACGYIYISDWKQNTVTRLCEDGLTLKTFTNPSWTSPLGLTTIGPNLLVCNKDGHTIDIVEGEGDNIFTLLDGTDGLVEPRAVCWCWKTGILYVSSAVRGSSIQAFKLSNI